MSKEVFCYNRDRAGQCMAYTKPECSTRCPARINNIDQKINLLQCLLARTQSKKDRRRLTEELKDAKKVKTAVMEGKMADWMSCYMEDKHRGSGGGSSEGDSSNRAKGMKQLMKDNRPVGVKPTRAQQEEYKEALQEFEESVGEKMPKLPRSSMTHSREDSYTGSLICFVDAGGGYCKGQYTAAGNLSKACRECSHLRWDIRLEGK